MRISDSLFINNFLAQTNQLQARQNQLQNETTTGLKVSLPEDDPAAMNQALNLQTQAAANTQIPKQHHPASEHRHHGLPPP